jgi:peptide/nickel transport system substrate-binding protein
MREHHGVSRRQFLTQIGAWGTLAAFGGVGAAQTKADAAPVRGGVLKVAQIGDPPTLDVHQTTANVVFQDTHEIFETLFALDANWLPRPMLARDIMWSGDRLTATIPLRTDVLFHDGTPMMAADAVASLRRWFTIGTYGHSISSNVKAITDKDAHTVVIELTQPVGPLLTYLADPDNMAAIMPRSLIDKYGDKPIPTPVGTGPYKFQEWKPAASLKVVRWDKYVSLSQPPSGHAGSRVAYVDEIDFIPVPDINTRLAGLQSGEYDITTLLSTDQYDQIKSSQNLVAEIVKPSGWNMFIFNTKKGQMANLKARQAVLKALNNKQIMEAAFGPQAFWDVSSPTLGYGSYTDNTSGAGAYNHQDIPGAKALLKEIGYSGQPVRFMTTKAYPYMYNGALVGKSQLEAVGFTVDLQVYDWATLVQRRSNPDLYEIFTTSGGSVVLPTLGFGSVSATWPGWWSDPRKKPILTKFYSGASLEARRKTWAEFQKLFYEDIPLIKTGDFNELRARQKRVQGFDNLPFFFLWNVWLAKTA